MAQYNPTEMIYHYRNYKKVYYSYDEELYAATFPEDWAKDHFPETGPKECSNCEYFGKWNGVFIGYCVNCAKHVYQGSRGVGFIDIGKEIDKTPEDLERGVPSAFETYLKDINPYDVGDSEFIDSANLVNSYQANEVYEDLIIDIDVNTNTFPSVSINIVSDDETGCIETDTDSDTESEYYGFYYDYTGSSLNEGYDSY